MAVSMLALLAVLALPAEAGPEGLDAADYLALLDPDEEARKKAYAHIELLWQPESATPVLETLRFQRDPGLNFATVALLEEKTGERHGAESHAWWTWVWSQPPAVPDDYATFKSVLYRGIDPRFSAYFEPSHPAKIRLDEIKWGGVRRDGIPPLREPIMVGADADYLADTDVVFGIEVDGDARAYPKRILAWHELFTDTVGGVPVAGVYCTLCGSAILYETRVGETVHALGTSGFLYRSNKLMYDAATQSLWSTLKGEPVVGPLVGKGIQLPRRAIVTTTWAAWKARHPDTQVASLLTGHRRDYSEGAAYRAYFASDELMFPVPRPDTRLPLKSEVLGLRFPQGGPDALAIAVAYLRAHPVLHERVAGVDVVVLTDASGAARVYAPGGTSFTRYDGDAAVVAEDGSTWTLHEDALVSAEGQRRPRLPAHRAFWFGWAAAFEDTRLVSE